MSYLASSTSLLGGLRMHARSGTGMGLRAGPRGMQDEGMHATAVRLSSYSRGHSMHVLHSRHSPRMHLSCCLSAHCAPLRMQRQRDELGGEPPGHAGGGRARDRGAPGQLRPHVQHGGAALPQRRPPERGDDAQARQEGRPQPFGSEDILWEYPDIGERFAAVGTR